MFLKPEGAISNKKIWVQGATGTKHYSWTTQRTVDSGMGQVTHSFLVMLEYPYPLLGQDFLTKMKAQIQFSSDRLSYSIIMGCQSKFWSPVSWLRNTGSTRNWFLHAGLASKVSLSMGRDGRHRTDIPPASCWCRNQVRGRSCKSSPISHAPQSKEGNYSTCKATAGMWNPETH